MPSSTGERAGHERESRCEMTRQRFTKTERSLLRHGPSAVGFEVRDGRTWYPTYALGPVEHDCIGVECVPVREVGKGTAWAYPGHVRPLTSIMDRLLASDALHR
jgi:hypothetical protein